MSVVSPPYEHLDFSISVRWKVAEIVQMARERKIEVVISQAIINEITRILRDKFTWSTADLQGALATVSLHTRRVEPEIRLEVAQGGLDDNRIFECAVAGRAAAIITGDQDLLRMGSYQGIRMMWAGEFLSQVIRYLKSLLEAVS